MAVCSGIKRDGGRCSATVELPKQYCWWHDPANADKRKRAASRGGKSKGNGELADLKKQVKRKLRELQEIAARMEALEEVLQGRKTG